MMTLEQAELEIRTRLAQFNGVDVIQFENQALDEGEPFSSPKDKLWCKAYIQYSGSNIVGIGHQPCIRDHGMISIQCFAPLNSGTTAMAKLCDGWRAFLQNFGVSHLEVYLVHAPQYMDDKHFYAKIVRAEFRVN
ncbi:MULTISPECIES: hypothetical protein [unclassified Acinetobacter]|uniref:hypothetical protein n=1 Tax=unclassified Acinetobacter TaxID=196816 RepID=UPI0025780F92|nr:MULTISPECIES: hypothetical protein [unclassified Acinetobacter]MDM1766005.1 hypothetical protein [Acinetobacter sp. 226-1]MDM1769772.1 hypothetical protein [Acinetobacter sp. 226-4]